MTRRNVDAIGVACGSGAQDGGCADAPDSLRAAGILRDLEERQSLHWDRAIRPPAAAGCTVDEVADVAAEVAQHVAAALGRGEFPLVVGGDHSCAIGTWAGVRAAVGTGRRFGLLWLDAHMDAHTFETTPSNAIHGMPLACLLGFGDPRLTGVMAGGAGLRPEEVCLIGVRSYEQGEAALLQRLGVRVYFMADVAARGMAAVFGEALEYLAARTEGYGISLDLDVLDPSEEAGVGSPVAGGMRKAELLAALRSIHDDRRLLALEIVEYNPHRDRDGATAAAIRDLCGALTE